MWIYLGQGHALCYWGQETSQVLTEPHGEGTGQGRHRSISLLLGLWPWYFGHQKGDTGWYWLPFTHFPTPPVIPSSRWWWYWSRAPCNPPAIAVEDQADVLIKEHCHHDEQRCPTQWYTVTDTLQVFWDWELFLQFWELLPIQCACPPHQGNTPCSYNVSILCFLLNNTSLNAFVICSQGGAKKFQVLSFATRLPPFFPLQDGWWIWNSSCCIYFPMSRLFLGETWP